MATNGGPGRGQGRKKGGINERTRFLREVTDKAIKAGITPIEVLLKRMRYHDARADTLLAEAEKLKNGKVAAKLEEAFAAMDRSRVFASEAAPYCHSRLNSVSIVNETNLNIRVITQGMTQDQADQLYLGSLREPPKILTIEHESKEKKPE